MNETNQTPVEKFVADLTALVVALVGSEMAKNGVIGQYPEKYAKDIKIATRNLVDFLNSQGADDLNHPGQNEEPNPSHTLEVKHEEPAPAEEANQPEKEPEPEKEEVLESTPDATQDSEKEVQSDETDTEPQPEQEQAPDPANDEEAAS